MAKELILSVNNDPMSTKYLMWALDEAECEAIRKAIGEKDDSFPLLTTLSYFQEDFECVQSRSLSLSQETLDLTILLEEHHQNNPALIKLLILIGGLGALANDFRLNIYGYAN